jgi:hypothetical protein
MAQQYSETAPIKLNWNHGSYGTTLMKETIGMRDTFNGLSSIYEY